MRRPSRPPLSRPAMVVFLFGVLALVVSGCANNGGLSGEAGATTDGFVIELADEIGPDAFTAPVDTAPTADADSGACDAGALLEKLEARPDAYREWAAVLGIPEDQVPDYIATLEPRILQSDTDVTNHGLRDGRAYARPSQLAKGTAVLVDTNFSGFPPGPDTLATTTTAGDTTTTAAETTTTAATTTTITPGTSTPGDGKGQPVTRCKCGNPLLPPYQPTTPAPTTTLTTTPTSSTTTTATVPRTTGGTPGTPPPLTTTIPVTPTTTTTIPTTLTTTTTPPPTSASTTSAPNTTLDDDTVGILRIPTRHGP